MSRKFNKTTLWHKLEKQNKEKSEKKRKMKEGKKGEKRHIVLSLLTDEIVKLTYEHRCKVLTI